MRSIHVATIAIIVAVLAWTAKTIAIGVAGGLDLSPLESPLFLVGLVAFSIAAISLGVALSANRPVWWRAVTGVLVLVAGVAVTLLIDNAVGIIEAPGPDRHWAWSEVNLWVSLVVILGVLTGVWRRDTVGSRGGRARTSAARA